MISPHKTSSAPSRQLTTGEALVRLLERYGVTHVFGIPGVHTIELYRGLAESSLTHVLAKHEQGAGFMADGFARATGRPATCFFITGPGVTNAVTAIGQAYSDSVPMLIFASTAAVGDLGRQRGRLHETKNQRAILEPVTAFAATAYKPEDVHEYVNRAFAVFASRRPRPVYIEIPLDVLAMPVADDWQPRRLSVRPGPREEDIDRAASLLARAKSPAIICGGGAWGAAPAIRALAERLSIPTFSTIAGKGIIPAGHPLQLDALLHLGPARRFLAECDVVLAIGTELAQSELLTSEPLVIGGALIRIDIDHEQLCDEQPTTLPILSDARLAMDAILRRIGAGPDAAPSASGEIRAEGLRNRIVSELAETERLYDRALGVIGSVLPAETMIFTDMTTIAYTGNFTYPVPEGGRWIHPAGYGSLGYGLPAAIGARIAEPGRPVVAIVGDGGFQFTLPELAVMSELGLPVLVILWNNGCFGQIKKGMVARNVTPVGVDYAMPNLCGIAEAYGITAYMPASPDEAAAVIHRAVRGDRPAIVELTPDLFA